MFEKAIEFDPKYADAYALLAWTFYFDWVFQWSDDVHALDRILDLAQKAIAIDNSRPMGYILLNRVALSKRQYEMAVTQIQRAIAIDPNSAPAYMWLGNTLAWSGRPAEAIRPAEKAMRLDPRNSDGYQYVIGLAYTFMGRYADAVLAYKKQIAHYPNALGPHVGLAIDYIGWVATRKRRRKQRRYCGLAHISPPTRSKGRCHTRIRGMQSESLPTCARPV